MTYEKMIELMENIERTRNGQIVVRILAGRNALAAIYSVVTKEMQIFTASSVPYGQFNGVPILNFGEDGRRVPADRLTMVYNDGTKKYYALIAGELCEVFK